MGDNREGHDFSPAESGDKSVALATEGRAQAAYVAPAGRAARILIAIALMLIGANSFLRYLWWSACYSAWSGIPKLHNQWAAAGSRATLNGWGVVFLELASVTVLFTLLRSKSSAKLDVIASVPRLMLAAILTITGTAFFALVLSWVKQGIQ